MLGVACWTGVGLKLGLDMLGPGARGTLGFCPYTGTVLGLGPVFGGIFGLGLTGRSEPLATLCLSGVSPAVMVM